MKDKRKNGNKERKRKNRELVRQACTNRLFPSLPLKILPSAKSKKGFLQAPTIQIRFLQKQLISVARFS